MRFTRWILAIPGSLLLLAAALKTHGLAIDPLGRVGIFSSPGAELAIIEFEIFLALWLWSGINQFGSWIVAFLTITAFSLVNFYQGFAGAPTCGCFGRLSVNPWNAFGVDVLVLVLLVLVRRYLHETPAKQSESLSRTFSITACAVAAIALSLGLLFTVAHTGFGSVPAAIAYFRGEQVSVHPSVLDFGEGFPGETHKLTVEVTNRTDKAVWRHRRLFLYCLE